jgi:hypothetical protein
VHAEPFVVAEVATCCILLQVLLCARRERVAIRRGERGGEVTWRGDVGAIGETGAMAQKLAPSRHAGPKSQTTHANWLKNFPKKEGKSEKCWKRNQLFGPMGQRRVTSPSAEWCWLGWDRLTVQRRRRRGKRK